MKQTKKKNWIKKWHKNSFHLLLWLCLWMLLWFLVVNHLHGPPASPDYKLYLFFALIIHLVCLSLFLLLFLPFNLSFPALPYIPLGLSGVKNRWETRRGCDVCDKKTISRSQEIKWEINKLKEKQKQRLYLHAISEWSSKTGAKRSFLILDKNVMILFFWQNTHKKAFVWAAS